MRPKPLNLFSISSTLLLFAFSQSVSWAGAQTPQRDPRPRTASIGGRVTVGGAPAANALVTVAESDPQAWDSGVESPQGARFEIRTDNDGRYRVTGLAAGSYVIRALSKAYVLSKSQFGFNAFKPVTVDDGESRDGVDIALVRGGVMTGRVSDAEGAPAIGLEVRLFSVDEKGKPKGLIDSYNSNWWMFQTDDRGVYRIYGLAAGRYILGAGGESGSSTAGRKSAETFYPDVADQDRAKIIEVKEGAEVTDIDIRLGAGKEAHDAAGRVVDAETGRPLPRVSVLCMESSGGIRHGISATTNDEGRFKCADLAPGQYDLGLREGRDISSAYYSEKIRFDVTDSDVSGLEVKAIRGATVSGVVVIEGGGNPASKANLQQMGVGLRIASLRESSIDGGDYERTRDVMSKVGGDGGFRLTGALPGMASFYMEFYMEGERFSIRRVERDGAEIRSAFEIGRGEQITGVRIVLAQCNETIRGQVEVAGVKLPEGCLLQILATPIKTMTGDEGRPAFDANGDRSTVADEKGRFVIEGLVPGEYELRLSAIVRVGQEFWSSAPGIDIVNRRVTVSSGAETAVNLILGPARK